MFEAVSLAIPGAKNARQASDNAAASNLLALSPAAMSQIEAIYNQHIRELVHQRW